MKNEEILNEINAGKFSVVDSGSIHSTYEVVDPRNEGSEQRDLISETGDPQAEDPYLINGNPEDMTPAVIQLGNGTRLEHSYVTGITTDNEGNELSDEVTQALIAKTKRNDESARIYPGSMASQNDLNELLSELRPAEWDDNLQWVEREQED